MNNLLHLWSTGLFRHADQQACFCLKLKMIPAINVAAVLDALKHKSDEKVRPSALLMTIWSNHLR